MFAQNDALTSINKGNVLLPKADERAVGWILQKWTEFIVENCTTTHAIFRETILATMKAFV